MAEKLCERLGMSAPSYWQIDPAGMEVAFAGLLMTARDFARLGELYRNGGTLDGRLDGVAIVPQAWVRQSVTPDAPHLAPGGPIVGDHAFGFGYAYQWWIPAGNPQEYSAIGVYNQFVYVDEARGCTIVKLSANRAYGTSHDEATNREHETIALLRGIAAAACWAWRQSAIRNVTEPVNRAPTAAVTSAGNSGFARNFVSTS